MPDIPKREVTDAQRLEWIIGSSDHPTDAKTFRFGLHYIYHELSELPDVDLEMDDAFFVRAGDGGEVIVYIDQERDKGDRHRAIVAALLAVEYPPSEMLASSYADAILKAGA